MDRPKKFRALLILSLSACLVAFGSGCTSQSPQRQPAARASLNYTTAFAQVREYLKAARPQRAGIKSEPLDGVAESAILENFTKHPTAQFSLTTGLLAEIKKSEVSSPDPTKHVRLLPPSGQAGYSDLKLYVSHPYFVQGRRVVSSDLVEVWKKFLGLAQKELVLNVFDFDLQDVAAVLIERAGKGVDVRVGIDKNVINTRPEVRAVHDLLVAGGVKVTAVDSTNLNHQKMAALDWHDPAIARVLFSSGNLTQSCLGPLGDLKGLMPHRPESIPNANHVITMKSWILANLVNHELTKTLDEDLRLRGSQYPLNGTYQVTGEGVDPETLETYPTPSLLITFTPNGAYNNVNQNLLAHVISKGRGPVRLLQFAYASSAVSAALLKRAQEDFQATGSFDFVGIGDTPFAMQYWSQFLKMSGYEVQDRKAKSKVYVSPPKNPWVAGLSPDQLNSIRPNIRLAPPEYGNKTIRVDGTPYEVSAKIHHKILVAHPFASLGTSFNFSQSAENNNEQVLIFHDPVLADQADGMVRYMRERSRSSVHEEVIRRMNLSARDRAKAAQETAQEEAEIVKQAETKTPDVDTGVE